MELLSETTTLVLLFYSLSLLFVFAFPRVRTATPTSIVALLLFAPWTASLLAGALCETKVDTGCVEIKLVEANSTLADQIIGFFDAEGKECVYHAKIPARCEAYFEAIDECPAERRRLIDIGDDGDDIDIVSSWGIAIAANGGRARV
jgi:hypothetical protein